MKKLTSFCFAPVVLAAFCLFTLSTFSAETPTSPDIVVHLLDYLAKDYGVAVQNGKVISEPEYAEQIEFAGIVRKATEEISSFKSDKKFSSGVKQLLALINRKASPEDVAKLALKLQMDAIRLSGIQNYPRRRPDLKIGAQLYQAHCVTCHGAQGKGDGVAGTHLDPKPANFLDPELVWHSSPYKFYNTIRLGVPGTGMTAYSQLTDQETWSLAFYLKSLPYADVAAEKSSKSHLSLKEVATLTDAQVASRLGVNFKSSDEKAISVVAQVRNQQGDDSAPLELAETLLLESLNEVKQGRFSEARQLALRAYLDGIEPIEPKLRANLPGSVEKLEALMSQYRGAIEREESATHIAGIHSEISQKLEEAHTIFSSSTMSAGMAFGASFSIFLREGFEAILIILVLMAIVKAMGQPQALPWIHVGWMAAVALGVGFWFASGALITLSGFSRELMEGLVSLLAVAVLIYVGFWLHRYTEVKKWRTFLENKMKSGLSSGSYIGLALVSFMAVFREAFEVVLFLRAIWLDLEPSGQSVAGLGIISSLVVLGGIATLAVRESRKLPIQMLFKICSWTMVILAFVLAGKGAHSLQEAGLLSASHSLPSFFRIDLLGIYPSVETLFVQGAVLAIFGLLLYAEKRPKISHHAKNI